MHYGQEAGALKAVKNGQYIFNGESYGVGKYKKAPLNLTKQLNWSKGQNFVKTGSKILTKASFAITAYQVGDEISNGRYHAATARAVVAGVAYSFTFIPVVGWGLALGIGVADAIWGDQFYNYIENKYGN